MNFIFGSIVVSIPACHVGVRGSIPRRRGFCLLNNFKFVSKKRFFLFLNWNYMKFVFFFSRFKASNLVSDSLLP